MFVETPFASERFSSDCADPNRGKIACTPGSHTPARLPVLTVLARLMTTSCAPFEGPKAPGQTNMLSNVNTLPVTHNRRGFLSFFRGLWTTSLTAGLPRPST